MKVIKQIKMDMQNKQNVPVIDAVQGDGNTRVLEFSLYSGGIVWNVPDGVSVAVAYMRPDGAKGIYDTLADGSSAVSVANNLVSAVLVPQAIAVAGETKLTVVFTTANGNQLATFCVVLKVESNPAIGAVEPEDYINLRQVLVEIVEKAMAEMGATGTFRVVISENLLAADKTFTEIYTAHEAGQTVQCLLINGEVLTLVSADPEHATFQNINSRYYSRLVINADDTVKYTSGDYVLRTDLPDEDVVGGYYSPTVTDNDDGTMTVSFTPSDADMPAVEPVTVELPAGVGVSGVRINETDDDRIILHIDLTNGGTNTVAWNKGTPVKGEDYWTEEDKAEIVGEARETVYYATLSQAIADVNNGTQDNAVAKLADAKVRVFTGDSGITTVMLLDDVSEDAQIDVSKDVNLVLGDYQIILSADARLNFAAGTECSITARGTGGINKTVIGETSNALYLAVVYGDSLIIDGGTYTVNGNSVSGCIAFATIGSCKTFKMDSCAVVVENSSVISTGDHVARCVQNQAAELQVNGSTLTANAKGPAQCIMGLGEMVVNKSILSAYSGTHAVRAVYGVSGTTTVIATTITSTTGASDSYAYGIYNDFGCVLTVRDSKILADAQGVNASTGSLAIACLNLGTAYFDNAEVNGTHSGIQNNGKLYVSGGTYTGYCHGGLYCAHGADGEAFIKDATIRCGNYEGQFDYSEMSGHIYGALYIGGGSEAHNSNMNVYVDGCTLDPAGHHISVVLRGTDDEQSNTLHISNSTLGDGGRVRIDNDTHILNVGVGTDITADKIVDKDGVKHGDWVMFTDCLYRKSDEATVCKGTDLNALTAYVGAKNQSGSADPEELQRIVEEYLMEHPPTVTAGIPVPDTASVGQTIVVKAVDENGKPTEWETADIADKWEIHDTITIEEEVTDIQIGCPDFSYAEDAFRDKFYKKIIVDIYLPVTDTTVKTTFSFGFNNWGGGNTYAISDMFTYGQIWNNNIRIYAEMLENQLTSIHVSRKNLPGEVIVGNFGSTVIPDTFSYIRLTNTYPVGSTITIWGCK